MTSLLSRDFLMKLSLQLLYIFPGRICFTVLASVATGWEEANYLDKSKPWTKAQRMIQKLYAELNGGGGLKVLAGTVLVDLWKFPCIRLLPDSVKPTPFQSALSVLSHCVHPLYLIPPVTMPTHFQSNQEISICSSQGDLCIPFSLSLLPRPSVSVICKMFILYFIVNIHL